ALAQLLSWASENTVNVEDQAGNHFDIVDAQDLKKKIEGMFPIEQNQMDEMYDAGFYRTRKRFKDKFEQQ
ncbi:hypothetical protein, partial [Enterococcus faecium]|uniref:hypothetical protein n=1 Tax=Enterococcus faecium TaxID=1352 RepID=UPI003DA13A51